jgi:hypothetical protein
MPEITPGSSACGHRNPPKAVFWDAGVRIAQSQTPSPQPPSPLLVGREAELTQLHNFLETALQGERQVVFLG